MEKDDDSSDSSVLFLESKFTKDSYSREHLSNQYKVNFSEDFSEQS
jgi:hypothetical protein